MHSSHCKLFVRFAALLCCVLEMLKRHHKPVKGDTGMQTGGGGFPDVMWLSKARTAVA